MDAPHLAYQHDAGFTEKPVTHARAVAESVSEAYDSAFWPRAMTLRLVIATCYVVLVPAGLLPMSSLWWVASAWTLFAYSLAVLLIFHRYGLQRWYVDGSPFADTFAITVAIIALAQPDYPLWAAYFLVITTLSMYHTTRYILSFAVWTLLLFWSSMAVLELSGRASISWELGAVVSFMTLFMALNSDMIAGSTRRLRRMVRRAALTDPLTGLDNRRRFREILDSHDECESQPLAVLMYDLDNFKMLNEEHGHLYADEVLVRVSEELRVVFRAADTVARYGGDEIVVLAHVASLPEAVAMAERSMARVREQAGVSVSAGVAVYPLTAATLDLAVFSADAALGKAKRSGKAQVVVAPALSAA